MAFVLYVLSTIQYVFLPIFILSKQTLKEILGNNGASVDWFVQLVPGKTILEYLKTMNLYQIIGNIVILMPLVFFCFVFSKKKNLKNIILLGCSTSIFIEIMQLFIDIMTRYPNRSFDIDDFILNSIGVIIAAYLINLLKKSTLFRKIYMNLIYQNTENEKNKVGKLS